MCRLWIVALVMIAAASAALAAAPVPGGPVVGVPSSPTTGAACSVVVPVVAQTTGHVWGCVAGHWADLTAAHGAFSGAVSAPLLAGPLDLDGDGTPDLAAAGKSRYFHGVADNATSAASADDASALGGVPPSGYVLSATRGAAGGVATLDSSGRVPTGQLPPTAPTAPMTTKGDLYGYDGSASARVPVGGDGSVLMADSASPTGVAYRSVEWIQRGTVDGVAAGLYPQSDEFGGATLDAKWSNPCPGNWDTAAPVNGALVLLRKSSAGLGVRAIYETAPTGDFAIVFKMVSFTRAAGVAVLSALGVGDGFGIDFGDGSAGSSPDRASQHSGMTVPATCSGGGGGSETGTQTLASGPGGYYFAIEKVGTAWSTYYSADGLNWTQFGTTQARPSFVPAYIAVWTYDGAYNWYSSISIDFLRVAPNKNSSGTKSWYLATYLTPWRATGSSFRADDTASRAGVLEANGKIQERTDFNQDAAADRHWQLFHGGSANPQVDFDGAANVARWDLDSDGTTDYTFAKPSSACASGNELGIDASGRVVCRAHPAVEHALSLGGCNGGAYAYGELVGGGTASFDCAAVSTYYRRPVALAPDGDASTFTRVIVPPAQWDGTYKITLAATYGATSGAVHWYEAHACVGDGDAYSAQPATGTSSTTTVPSTQDRQQTVTLSVTGLSACAGKTLVVVIGRDGANADDTMAGTAYLAAAKIAFGVK